MLSGKKGNVLLYLIMGMSLMASLGLGLFYVNTTSTFSQIGANNLNKAHYLAESGMRYALQELRNRSLLNTTTAGTDYTLSNTTKGKFNLKVSGVGVVGSEIKITSTGVSNPDTPFEVRKTITVIVSVDEAAALVKAPFSFAGTGSGGMAALAAPAEGVSEKSGVTVDTVNKQINLGSGQSGTAGCVWYQGWADSNGSDCVNGNCNFNKGFRAYFDFQYDTPSWQGDGFTFAIVSGHDKNKGTNLAPVYINNVTDCGGGSYGEYMAYAGTGVTTYGLQPPKIAVEFDPNITNFGNNICKADNTPNNNSRNDDTFSTTQQHSTLVYWGSNQNSCFPSSNTYDDNRHGAGNNIDDPKNPDVSDTGTFYLLNYDDPIHAARLVFRMEIDRIDIPPVPPATVGGGTYKIRVWMQDYANCIINGCPDSNGVMLNDTSKKYSNAPTFQQTITMSQASGWHEKFDRILFGWTQATDSTNTQTVIISNFAIDFKKVNDF